MLHFHSEAEERGFQLAVIAQFEGWEEVRASQGVSSGESPQAGHSHPDFGKKWSQLNPEVQAFITRLFEMRTLHFQELATSNELETLFQVGNGQTALDSKLQEKVARRFHDDWMAVRKERYSVSDETAAAELRSKNLRPWGEHEGDKPFEQETPAQQQNDLLLVPKLSKLLAAWDKSPNSDLQAYVKFLRNA